MKLGGLTTSVGASLAGDRLMGRILPDSIREARTKKVIEKNAARMVRTMGELKGAAMKLGQILSMAPLQEEMMPEELRDALSVLQRSAPPMSWQMITEQIERAFDQPVEALFRFFDPEPLAAASIGQVHRAELFDGRVVAVKVQYPGVAETLESDLKNISTMAQMGRPFASAKSIEDVLEEIRQVLRQESDYLVEAASLRTFQSVTAERSDVKVPAPIMELTRETVLTMEFMEGEKLDRWLMQREPALRNDAAKRFIELIVWLFHDEQLLHADPHPGNFLVDAEGRFVMLDFGAIRRYEAQFTDGVLKVLVAVWKNEGARLPALFEALGFGEGTVKIDAQVLEDWTRLVCAPFFVSGPFNFGTWSPHSESQRFMLRHPKLMVLTPPPEMVYYGRTCLGLWGLLQRLSIEADVSEMAKRMAKERGLF